MSSTVLHKSLWEETARPAPETSPLEGDARADVVVIGGAFCGLSCALHLAEGGADTVLLESEAPGFGASGRNGGQLISGFKDDPETLITLHGRERGEAIARLGAGAGDLVARLIAKHGIDCAFHRDGWIQAIHSAAGVPKLESRALQLSARGQDVRMLDRAEVAALTGTDIYVGGYLDNGGGGLNPMSLARGLTAARSQEVRRALWEKIDFDAGMWVIPALRMNKKREHRIPLSTEALKLLVFPT